MMPLKAYAVFYGGQYLGEVQERDEFLARTRAISTMFEDVTERNSDKLYLQEVNDEQ
jgi:hypothetical protein